MAATETAEMGGSDGGLLEGWRLDAVITLLATLLVVGLTLDFRVHVEGISFAEEGFFTPEHVFFYSMFLGIAAIIGARTVANRREGASWIAAVPPGYGVGVLGVLLFGVGGGFDYLWHLTFGFEEDVEGLVSPSHLLLATGATLYLSSPARATWRRASVTGGPAALSASLSLALGMSVVSLFFLFANPLADPFPAVGATGYVVDIGLVSVIAYGVLLLAPMLALARRFDLPPGSLTLFGTVPGAASAFPTETYALVVPAIAMGLVADAFLLVARPTPENPRAFRLFGALVPAAFAASYVATVIATSGIVWTVHVWVGVVVYTGLAGLGLTYAIHPTSRWHET